jgi:hypothetical protein
VNRDEIARRIDGNLSQAETNIRQVEFAWHTVDAKLNTVKSAPWRLFRNRRLLAASRRLIARNGELLDANSRLMADNAALLALHRSSREELKP